MFTRMCLLYLLYPHVIVIRAKGSYSGPSVYKIAGVVIYDTFEINLVTVVLFLLKVDQLFFSR